MTHDGVTISLPLGATESPGTLVPEDGRKSPLPSLPFRVWSADRKVKKSLAAKTFADVLLNGARKLGVSDSDRCNIVLEECGTLVEDDDYLRLLPANTILMILRPSEKWLPSRPEDGPNNRCFDVSKPRSSVTMPAMNHLNVFAAKNEKTATSASSPKLTGVSPRVDWSRDSTSGVATALAPPALPSFNAVDVSAGCGPVLFEAGHDSETLYALGPIVVAAAPSCQTGAVLNGVDGRGGVVGVEMELGNLGVSGVSGCATTPATPRRLVTPPKMVDGAENLEAATQRRFKRKFKDLACAHEGCAKRFRDEYDRKTHMRSHTGERPFKCHSCDKRFAHLSSRIHHNKTVHMRQREFVCSVCGMTFVKRAEAQRHQWIAHNIPSVPPRRCQRSDGEAGLGTT